MYRHKEIKESNIIIFSDLLDKYRVVNPGLLLKLCVIAMSRNKDHIYNSHVYDLVVEACALSDFQFILENITSYKFTSEQIPIVIQKIKDSFVYCSSRAQLPYKDEAFKSYLIKVEYRRTQRHIRYLDSKFGSAPRNDLPSMDEDYIKRKNALAALSLKTKF